MPRSYEIVQENNVNTYWDNVVSQNVAVYEKDGASCQIWLEDASSIAEKVKAGTYVQELVSNENIRKNADVLPNGVFKL